MCQSGDMNIGQLIATQRKKHQLTQAQLAEKLYVSKSAVAKWETGGGIPDRDNLKRLSEIFNISTDELHGIISGECMGAEYPVNITVDVITVLESHGYKVISPDNKKKQ